jgi:integrase
MGKVLAFARVSHRQAASGPPAPIPRVNPAQSWLDRRKNGKSRETAISHLNMASRLMGYGSGSNTDYASVPWWTFGYEDIAALRAKLREKVGKGDYVPHTANVILQAVKGVMVEVWRIGVGREAKYLTAEALAVIKEIEPIAGKRLRKPRRALSTDEFDRLIAHCAADDTPKGKRDTALAALSKQAGFRASEYASLTLTDYDRTNRRLRVPQIKSETSEQDIWHPLEDEAIAYLERWLVVRGNRPGALFTRLERGGVGIMQHMHPQAVSYIMTTRGEAAGIDHFSSHATRRGFITNLLKSGADLGMAQKLARHSDPETTARHYDLRDDDDKRAAIKRLLDKKDAPD